MKKILLVEDNEIIIKGLKYSLEQEDFEVTPAKSVFEAKRLLNANKYNLIILDVMLPDGNGFELCKFIKEKEKTPVIFLTAKDEEQDVVNGLELEAEDYVIKPFRTRELILRINNILKRYEKVENKRIQAGNVIVDVDASRVFVNGQEIEFTALEYKILLLLFWNIGKTVTRDSILDRIWDVAGNFVNDNTLTVYVKRIRAKLGKEDIIKTVKGIGYRID
ncbi:MAG: response regulator transcription factor [Clostridia bacterium]